MFSSDTYIKRREQLRQKVKCGIIFLPGHNDSPMNYASNPYKFRQDSSFLYYFGLDVQGLAGIIDVDNNEDVLFGNNVTIDDIVWMGDQPSVEDMGMRAGISITKPYGQLYEKIGEAIKKNRTVHYLPPYRGETKILLEELLKTPVSKQRENSSGELIKAVADMRSVKEPQEIEELENAMEVAYLMHTNAMKMAKPGVYEREIAGVVEGVALLAGTMMSFPVILTKHGETLHNHDHSNKLEKGDLMLVDAGCESALHYATDHTRTMPVGGKYSSVQKDIYQIVLDAQTTAIDSIKEGVTNMSVHMKACSVIAEGLKNLGLMKGDAKQAVEQGAHALFMPHGLGHMLGLDAHDMENLGEDVVGYDKEVKRSNIFGADNLRLGRKLHEGFVITVEPGIYFIPQLIEKWENEKKFPDFIDYEKVKSYIGFGGIRIEDDILVTNDGCRVLGKPIPKTIEEVEAVMNES